ncbi:MAG: hypothetical protein KKE44_22545, partial [Proteobacteria bacterium]|nr:hypothetical protein [Pseudomonadota bacterium]
RFFKKGMARLPCRSVHEQITVKGGIGSLRGHLLHYPYPSFSEYLTSKLGQLDAVLLENDSNSVDFINWMIEKAVFFDDDRQTANYLFGKWQTNHDKSGADYLVYKTRPYKKKTSILIRIMKGLKKTRKYLYISIFL